MTLTVLLALLDGLAARRPVFLIFEDVHWADPTSRELLTAILDRVPRLRVLLLITARPEFTPPWPGHAHVTTVSLTRLSRRDGAALIERVTAGKALPEEVMNEILARTDGVPLSLRSSPRRCSSGTAGRAGWAATRSSGRCPCALAIPTTLHASLIARLDRLAAVREVAQIRRRGGPAILL